MDGSNIATEGRAAPSLKQLDEAVRALLEEHPYEHVTVVVDATFPNRIDASELDAYEEAMRNGELLTPPAGAIGRGDAFVLQIADRAKADVFSNDSFQEFHGQYPWLFDEGRLIGGKPVPNVGWVFVLRAPVRGPTSRRAVREAKRTRPSKAAPAAPMKTPRASKSAAPAKKATMNAATPPEPTERDGGASSSRSRRRRTSSAREPINEQLVYAAFVIDHPVGSIVDGVVDRFSSHGAYVHAGSAQCYVPLRELGDPPPRSAREVLTLGEERSFVVQRFDPVRRGIDVVPADAGPVKAERGSDAAEAVATAAETSKQAPAEEANVSPAAKKASTRKKAAAKRAPAKKKATAKRAPARKTAAKKKATAKKAVARKKATVKKAVARKKATVRKAVAKKKAPAKRTTARKR